MNLPAFAESIATDMMAAQAAGAPPEADDRAAADLSAERRERTLYALYNAVMLGLPDDHLRHLCAECGVPYRDVETYTPPILRRKQEEATDTRLPPF